MVNIFLDVPVYRLREEEYYRQREAFVNEAVHSGSHAELYMRDHMSNVFGGCWPFNEITGYIRLHFLGGQVRGEYFGVAAKRIVRTRRKRFEYKTHKLAPEIEIERPINDASVEAAVRQYIDRCRAELPGRHIDVAVFEIITKHLRWRDLWIATTT